MEKVIALFPRGEFVYCIDFFHCVPDSGFGVEVVLFPDKADGDEGRFDHLPSFSPRSTAAKAITGRPRWAERVVMALKNATA